MSAPTHTKTSDKLNDAANVIAEVGNAFYLAQAILVRASNFLQGIATDFEVFWESEQRSR
ncbi:hypothetical protein LCGC14_2458020 [marine sediment metagenome]|uniref:Uncharacterized protein n=1 Tax=marine sediment metagenome TaxID=412755 RepID=A0A0F9E7Y6_9ZZZZ